MSFEPPSLRSHLEAPVAMRPVVRILLALVIVTGGLGFAVIGAALLLWTPPVPRPHPIGAAILSFAMSALGVGFVWFGVRLMRARAGSGNLLSPVARRRCSLIVGALSVAMAMVGVEAGNGSFLAAAACGILFSYWLFPL